MRAKVKLAGKGSGGSESPTVRERIPISLKLDRVNFRGVRANE